MVTSLMLYLVMSLSSLYLLYLSPIMLFWLLILISILMVSLIGSLSQVWYSYVLFLVYVGGLLVLFMYICMVSSNFKFTLDVNFYIIPVMFLFGTLSITNIFNQMGILGESCSLNGKMLSNYIIIGLGGFLLISFLGVVRVTLDDNTCLKIEPN